MQFSKQSSGRKIKRITLINIQGIEKIVYEFEESGVTRIHAPSETGKSILTKAMLFFVLGQVRYKDIRESLLRDDTSQSLISIKMYNNKEVAFIYRNEKPLYVLVDEEGHKTIYQTEIPPKEILDELGYYVDQEEDICLNIREDEPLALVHTSDKVNSAIFNCILENPVIENTIEKIENTLEVLKKTHSENLFYQNVCRTTLNNLEHIEETEEELDNKLNRIDYYSNIITNLNTNNQSLKVINNHVSTLKSSKQTRLDIDKIRNLIELNKILLTPNLENIVLITNTLKTMNKSNKQLDFNLIKSQIKILKTLEQSVISQGLLNNSTNTINSIENKKIEKTIELMNSLNKIYKPLSTTRESLSILLKTTIDISNKTKLKEEQINETKIKQDILVLNTLNNHKELTKHLKISTNTIKANSKIQDTVNTESIKASIDITKALNNLLAITKTINLFKIIDINTQYKDTTDKLNKLKEKHKVCPLCQKPFTLGEHVHQVNERSILC